MDDKATITACAYKSIDAAKLTEGKGSPIECMISLYKIAVESAITATTESHVALLTEHDILSAFTIFVCNSFSWPPQFLAHFHYQCLTPTFYLGWEYKSISQNPRHEEKRQETYTRSCCFCVCISPYEDIDFSEKSSRKLILHFHADNL